MNNFEPVKVYDPVKDLWVDENNCCFVENKFDPRKPIFIDVSGDLWIYSNKHTSYIDWNEIKLPVSIKNEFRWAIREKLRINSVAYLDKCRLMLLELSKLDLYMYSSILNVDIVNLLNIFDSIPSAYQSFLRELYDNLSLAFGDSGSRIKSKKLKKTNIKRRSTSILKEVLEWNPNKGALTIDEKILFLKAIKNWTPSNTKEHATKIFGWLLAEMPKRSKQIRELKRECLKIVQPKNSIEYFVKIKPVKFQTGKEESWWPISEDLYYEMISYSTRPDVKRLQEKYDLYLVFDSLDLHRNNVIGAATFKSLLQDLVKNKLKLECDRTGEYLNVTPNRLRHTGATELAYKGVPREIISEALEHDNSVSCQSYIDAIGSELCPSINKADRNMGGMFQHFKTIYFDGKIVNELSSQRIVVPDFNEVQPLSLFVGSCSRDTCKEGVCKNHPFISCYNGCPNFLAWKEADHKIALNFVEKELDRWRSAIDNQTFSSTIQEYELLKENIVSVIQRIESSK